VRIFIVKMIVYRYAGFGYAAMQSVRLFGTIALAAMISGFADKLSAFWRAG
jgi:hypothetical protein